MCPTSSLARGISGACQARSLEFGLEFLQAIEAIGRGSFLRCTYFYSSNLPERAQNGLKFGIEPPVKWDIVLP